MNYYHCLDANEDCERVSCICSPYYKYRCVNINYIKCSHFSFSSNPCSKNEVNCGTHFEWLMKKGLKDE